MNFLYIKRYLKNKFFYNNPLYLYYFKFFVDKHKELFINQNTDIIVEGFPRSGNSFLVFYLKKISKNKINIASHTHHPAHVMKGYKEKKTIIIVIREPIDAVVSLFIFYKKKIKFELLIDEYISFYNRIFKYKDEFIILNFETIIKNPKKVINIINSKNKKKRLNYSLIKKNVIFNLLKVHSKKKFNIVDKYQNSLLQKEYKNEKKAIKKLLFKEVSQEKIKQSRKLYKNFLKIKK